MIRGLHHNAWRCRDSEETRRFYEDFLGLPLAGALWITETKSGRATDTLHTFYRLIELAKSAARPTRRSSARTKARR